MERLTDTLLSMVMIYNHYRSILFTVRSVKAGCRTIITRSRNVEDFIQIYELLADVMVGAAACILYEYH